MEQIFFSHPLKYEIIKYLSALDIYRLYISCKGIYKILNLPQQIINKLQKSIDKIDPNFYNVLKKFNCVISGSFVLQTILNEYWENSDIDIYVDVSNVYFDIHPICTYLKYISKSPGFVMKQYNSITNEPIKNIFHVTNFNINGKKIQIIEIKENPVNFINTTFDFEICKNIYSVGEKLIIPNFKNIVKKKTDFDYSINLKKSLARVKKYSNRGFYFTFDKNILQKCIEKDNLNIITNNFFCGNISNNSIPLHFYIDHTKLTKTCQRKICIINELKHYIPHVHTNFGGKKYCDTIYIPPENMIGIYNITDKYNKYKIKDVSEEHGFNHKFSYIKITHNLV